MKKLISTLLLVAILTGCKPSTNALLKRVAQAKAEQSCLLLDENLTDQEKETGTALIPQAYGFEDNNEMTEFIASIKGTAEHNQLRIEIRKQLEARCLRDIERAGVDLDALIESTVQ